MFNYEFLWALLVVLILISGFFSSSETGMMSINRYRLRNEVRKGDRRAKRVAMLLSRPDRLLGVILLGNTFANILASAIATILAVHYFGESGLIFSTIVLTIIVLIFAETAPKTMAALYPRRVAFFASNTLKILLKVLYPLVWVINITANAILKLFRINVATLQHEPLSVDEFRTLVSESTGKINANYQSMLLRILDLEGVTVENIMVPRADVCAIDLHDSWDDIVVQLKSCSYSYVPLYTDNVNSIIGVVSSRAVLKKLSESNFDMDGLREIALNPYFVPGGAALAQQLKNFLRHRQRVGLVVDEYGELQGLVTLQDIVEEVIGEFDEELNELVAQIKPQANGSMLVDGQISIRDLNRQTHWSLPISGAKTLSGLLIEYLEAIPAEGLGVRISGYPMEIVAVESNVITLVRVWPALYNQQNEHEIIDT